MSEEMSEESKCERCGVSCHFTAQSTAQQQVAVWGLHCKFLRRLGEKSECSVYANRFEEAPWCHHSSEAAPKGMLRSDCPYSEGPGKTALRGADYDAQWPLLLAQVRHQVWPAWADAKDFLSELAARDPGTQWECVEREGGLVFQPEGQPPPFLIVMQTAEPERPATEETHERV